MSDELSNFVEESVESEVVEQEVTEEVVEPTVEPEAAQPEAELEPETEPGLPTEPDTEKSEQVPIAALKDEREKRQRYQRELDELRAQIGTTQETPVAAVAPKAFPTLEEAGYDEAKYQQMVTEYNLDTNKTLISEQFADREREIEERMAAKEMQFKVSNFFEKGKEIADDFVALTQADFAVTEVMRDTLLVASKGAEVMYHLAKNHDLADRISKLPANQQALELGRLDERFNSKPVAEVPEKPAVQIPQSLTNVRAEGGNKPIVVTADDPLESTFDR